MKKLIAKINILMVIIYLLIGNISFAADAGIRSTDKTVTSGKDSTVTVTISSSKSLGSYKVTLTDAGGLEFSSASGGEKSQDGKTISSASSTGVTTLANYTFRVPDVSEKKSYTVSFSVSALEDTDLNSYDSVTNRATITVNPKPTTTSTPQSTGTTTTKPQTTMPSETKANNNKTETTKSSNNYLSALSIVGEGATLSPEFYRETYEYTVEYGEDVNLYDLTEIELEAKAEDSRATVKGAGKITLEEGENSIPITVTAENGTERTYTIKVVKPKKVEQSELRLQTLVLNGIKKDGTYQTIEFELDSEKFEYDLQVPNDIKGISVNPTTENEDIIIEKVGNEDLEEGENKIEITLTSPSDKEITTTYVLKIQREAAPAEEAQNNNQQMYMIAGGVGILILLIIIILIVRHRKKKTSKNSEFEEFGLGEEEESNKYESSDEGIDYKMQSMQYVNPQKEITVDDVEVPELKWEEDEKEDLEAREEVEKEDKKKKDKKTGRRFL